MTDTTVRHESHCEQCGNWFVYRTTGDDQDWGARRYCENCPRIVTLRASYGCCDSGANERCDCWCHDPTQGGNNFDVADMERPEVAAVSEQIARTGKPWDGSVEWVDGRYV